MIHALIGGVVVVGLAYVAISKHLTLASVKAEVLKIEASPLVTDSKGVVTRLKAKLGL